MRESVGAPLQPVNAYGPQSRRRGVWAALAAPSGSAFLLTASLLLASPLPALAQQATVEIAGTPWCTLPLCKEADALRRQGDLQGAVKLYSYIQDEVDVDESVVRKPLLWFVIAALHEKLRQPQPGLEALQKYQKYLAAHPDSELPIGQRRGDVERLLQALNLERLRVASGAEAEPPPAALRSGAKVAPGDGAAGLTPTTAEAEKHLEAGLALSRQGLQRSARAELEQAYQLSHRPELLYSIAQLLLSRGQPREAAEYYQRYLDAAPQGVAHAAAAATLARVKHELALEAEAARTTEALRLGRSPGNASLRQAGIALLSIGGGLLVIGAGLGIGAVATGRSVMSAERYDPTLERTGQGLQNSGIALDVIGGLSLGIGTACLTVARRREALLPQPLPAPAARAALAFW